MNDNYLLDTNIIIGLLVNDSKIVSELKKNIKISMPTIVLGELFYSAMNSIRKNENLSKVQRLAESIMVLNVDFNTALFYGEIKSSLKKKGTPLPENDIWIAALSIQHKLRLVSRDNHFKQIEGIQLIQW